MKKEEIEKIEETESELEVCKKEKEDYLNGWKREKADFLNYKKDESERIKSILDYKINSLVFEFLPILDNFEMAEKQIPDEEKENNKFIKGLLQIKKDVYNFLKDLEVEELKSVGEKFNPHYHEAIEIVDGNESEIIIEELVKGYKRGEKLIRPSKVKITK